MRRHISRILSRRTYREFIGVGLAEDDRTRFFELFDDKCIVWWNEPFENLLPAVVSTPLVQMMSLTAIGTPSNGNSSPSANRESASEACCNAS